jgi:hypothetical protein
MSRDVLKSTAGERVEVDRGESSIVTITFKDALGSSLNKDSIQTLTVTLRNSEDNSIINNRDSQSLYDENNGTISAGGVLTWLVQPEDNAIIGPVTPGKVESHYATFRWTYSDASGNPMVGKHQFEILVSECSG